MKYKTVITHLIVLIPIYLIAVLIRIEAVQCHKAIYKKMPFTLESAMLFYYADYYDKNLHFPQIDKRAQYPEGLEVAKKLSVGKGIVAAWIHNVFFPMMDFEKFVRFFIPGFFCLGVLVVYLSVWILSESLLAASLAALFYGIALPGFIRSAGIEFSRENFAFPFIVYHCASLLWLIKNAVKTKVFLKENSYKDWFFFFSGVVSLAIALSTWDMTQVYLLVLLPFWIYLIIVNDLNIFKVYLIVHILSWLIVGCIVPYLYEHYFIFSLPMIFYFAVLLGSLWANKISVFTKFLFIGSILLISQKFLANYNNTYSHMLDLFFAKIWFLGMKPTDPLMLSYNVRSVWVPELQSAFEYVGKIRHLDLFLKMFCFLAIPYLLLIFRFLRQKCNLIEIFVLYLVTTFLILFLLFSRLEIFLIYFLAVFIGLSFYFLSITGFYKKVIWIAAVVVLLIVNAQDVKANYMYWGRSFPYHDCNNLIGWMEEKLAPENVVLADFGLSATILAYTDCKTVLHPKFESKDMRDRVKSYIEAIFSIDESKIYQYCENYDIDYYVHSVGIGGDRSIFSWRYLYGNVDPVTDMALHFENQSNLLDKFELVYDNSSYKVFKVINQEDVVSANDFIKQANHLFTKGEFQQAENYYRKALEVYPKYSRARLKLSKVLRIQGKKEEAISETKKALLGIRIRNSYK